MGNQCCGNTVQKEQGEMVFASAIPVRLTSKLSVESTRFQSVMQTKQEQEGQNFFNTERVEEFTLTIKPYSSLESPSSISLQIKVKQHDFSYKNDMDWKIDEDVLIDPNQFTSSVLRGVEKKSGEKYSIRVVNFDDYEDYNFKSALYEIYILQLIQQNQASATNIATLKDVYILESEDKDHHKGSIIMLMEYCDSTLHEIIAFRKFHQWKWTDNELATIFSDLALALAQLESLNIAHRDIRPQNIWYCSYSQKYKISGFQDAKVIKKAKLISNNNQLGLQSIGIQQAQHDTEDLLNTVRGVPDFLAPEVSKYLENQTTVGVYNAFIADVYQLGLCIIMMMFLSNNFESQDIRSYMAKCKSSRGGDRSNIGSKNYEDLVKMMLVGDEKSRLSPAELSLFASSLTHTPIIVNEDNLIKSMKFKKKWTGIDATKVYQLVAMAYFDLFEWEKWHEKMTEILVTYESLKDDRNQAQVLQDIAEGYMEINNPNSAQEYFMKASVIFNELGHAERKNGQIDETIQYYLTALDCVRKAHSGEDSYEGAMMLENLGNVYRLKGETKKARSYLEEAQRIVQKEKGEESLENAKVLINLGKLYTIIADYKHALKRIKKAIKITDNFNASNTHQSNQLSNSFLSTGGQPQNIGQLIKAGALAALGEIQRLKGRLDKAKQNIEEALQIRQTLQGNGHVDVASTVENLGNVYFEMEDYHQALSYYEKALVIKKNKLGENNPEIALTLNNIGNACKHLNENDKAQKFFTDALQILQQTQGEDNPLMGTTYGNLGILLKEQGNVQGASHCLNKCTTILSKTLEPNHPDHQFYQDHLSQLQKV